MYHHQSGFGVGTDRQKGFHTLFLIEWRRRGITNPEMARRLGRSPSLVNKIKGGRAPLTGLLIDQLAEILEINVVRAYFAVEILKEPMIYFDPVFDASINKTMALYAALLADYRGQTGSGQDESVA